MSGQTIQARWEAPRWVCIAAVGLGIAGLAVQCAIDIYQSILPGMDLAAKLTQAWQMTLPSGYKIVLAAICGVLLRYGHWFKAFILFGLAIVFMAYSASNSMDFLANQSVAYTKHQADKATTTKDITKFKNDLTVTERKEATENLWRVYVAAKAADRDKILDQIKSITAAPVALEAVDIDVMQVGIGATLNRYGIRPESLQELRAVIFPIAVVVTALVCISLGFAGWPKAELWKTNPPSGRNSPDFPESFRKVTKAEARSDIIAMTSAGASAASAQDLAERWGVGEGTVSKWLSDFKKEGLIRRGRNGRNLTVIGVAEHLNGKVPAGSA